MDLDTEPERLICAVDLGGTNLRAAVIDRQGRIHERLKHPTPKTDSAGEVMTAIAAAIRECEAECHKRDERIDAISVAVPGSVQIDTGEVSNAPNIPALAGYKLGSILETELGRPVLIENDANAAALGEMWQGAGRGCRTLLCLTLGTGVGGGIILDGKLWRGVDGTAGELGHISIEPFGNVKCGCGGIGCLEVYASATAIVRMAREGLARHPNSVVHSVNPADLTSEIVCQAAIAGDQLAGEVFQSVGVHLGIAMAGLIDIFNPEIIVVGGGVSAAWEMFAEPARAEIMKRAFPVPARRCLVERGECGDDAGLLGAAWLAFEKTNL